MKKLLIIFIALIAIETSVLGYYFYIRFETNKIVKENEVLGVSARRLANIKKPRVLPTPTSTLVPSPTPTPTVVPNVGWSIKSVSSMKETKDRICNQRSSDFVYKWVARAKELGANYVAVETPYDSPPCADALSYTKLWVQAVRESGMSVWHRHMPLAFEAIYDTPKSTDTDYLSQIENYITSNASLFASGDIFTPIAEPQNGGIQGVTYCDKGTCQFDSKEDFNTWLRDAIDVSNSAFATIALGGKVKTGYYGFDGFVAWGHNNPDWDGILEDATIAKMGNITIDHYPQAVGTSMDADLAELTTRYPNTPIVIGEWGTINSGEREMLVRNTMQTFRKYKQIIGVNYWHLGVGGHEGVINDDLSVNEHYDDVQYFYKNQ